MIEQAFAHPCLRLLERDCVRVHGTLDAAGPTRVPERFAVGIGNDASFLAQTTVSSVMSSTFTCDVHSKGCDAAGGTEVDITACNLGVVSEVALLAAVENAVNCCLPADITRVTGE
jgi:hypothetical protein